jgi:hypothetical protein
MPAYFSGDREIARGIRYNSDMVSVTQSRRGNGRQRRHPVD